MDTQHFLGKVAAKAMIIKDGKVLITRSEGDELWDFPGGRIHTGESVEEAVVREVMEEIGAEIHVEGMIGSVQSLHSRDNAHMLFIIMKATLADPSVVFTNPDREADETRWIGPEDVESAKLFPQWIKPLKTFWNLA